MKRLRPLASLVAISALILLAISASAADTTVLVTGDTAPGENQPGWMFNRDASTSTPFEFNENEASIGVGSLNVLPIGANAADKFIGELFLNEAIADVDSFSYDFQIGSGGDASDANQFYLNVYANFGVSDDLKFYDCRYRHSSNRWLDWRFHDSYIRSDSCIPGGDTRWRFGITISVSCCACRYGYFEPWLERSSICLECWRHSRG